MARLREALLSAECLVGEAISDQISRHHRRRLRRIGWEHALDAGGTGWASGEPSPRPGNAVDIMIDGAEALPIMARELSAARSHIHMTNWFLSPDFELVRGDKPVGKHVVRVIVGGPGPSYVNLPTHGCWRLSLQWSGRSDELDLDFVRRS